MSETKYVSVRGNSQSRAVVNYDHFEFASLKEGVLSICMGHALGNDDDFAFGVENGGEDAMIDFSKSIDALMEKDESIRKSVAVLMGDDGVVRAILNLKKLAYVYFHIDVMNDHAGHPVPMECLDIWYANYGFRLVEEDAVSMYENICEQTGQEP